MKKIYILALALFIVASSCVGGLSYLRNTYDEFKSEIIVAQAEKQSVYSVASDQINGAVDEIESIKTGDESIDGINYGVSDLLKWYGNKLLNR